jgi:PAS domain-containing protein
MDAKRRRRERVSGRATEGPAAGDVGSRSLCVRHVMTEREGSSWLERPTTVVSDALLRSAFDRSPTGMTVSSLDGRCLWVNDAYCRMLSYQRAQLLGLCETALVRAQVAMARAQAAEFRVGDYGSAGPN